MRHLVTLFFAVALLSACVSQSKPTRNKNLFKGNKELLIEPSQRIKVLGGDFSQNQTANSFIDRMVFKHRFAYQDLHNLLAKAKKLDYVIRLIDRQAPTSTSQARSGPNGAWIRYRDKFITPDNVQKGVAFWNKYQNALQRAQRIYGVPPEIIVGIIGVETRWGRVMGKTRIIDALSTLSFNYPRRAKYFQDELETFLVMARKEGHDPLNLRGSFAGAMGYGQFMPSAFKQYAVDFNSDGHIDLWSPVDAIGSIANYFQQHGWLTNGTVAVQGKGETLGLKNRFKTLYTSANSTTTDLAPDDKNQKMSLLKFDVDTGYQYWYCLPNFYVITHYNHSKYYAMAVWQLGKTIRDAQQAR